jgi:CheY-like chemotaxis protein
VGSFYFTKNSHDQPTLTIRTEGGKNISFQILFSVDEQWASIQMDEQDSLELVRRLSQRLPAMMEEIGPQPGQAGPAKISLIFTIYSPRRVLIVDDQDTAQKMYQRYLGHTNLDVVGITNPAEVLSIAQQIQPAFVILDVMMPHIDGWEVLQTLQLDPHAKHIPVIVCSAWGEPELARALGAVAFLKKPVIQKELLAALSRLGLIQE